MARLGARGIMWVSTIVEPDGDARFGADYEAWHATQGQSGALCGVGQFVISRSLLEIETDSGIHACVECVRRVIGIERSQLAEEANRVFQTKRQWWLLVRVTKRDDKAWQPLWWTVDRHDGAQHAVSDGHRTISFGAPVEADSHEEAVDLLGPLLQFHRSMLEGLSDGRGVQAPTLRRIELAERMVEWWGKEYAAALAEEKGMP